MWRLWLLFDPRPVHAGVADSFHFAQHRPLQLAGRSPSWGNRGADGPVATGREVTVSKDR